MGYNATCASGAPCVTMEQLTLGWEVWGGSSSSLLGVEAEVVGGSGGDWGGARVFDFAIGSPKKEGGVGGAYTTPWDASVFRGCLCGNTEPLYSGPMAGSWARGRGLGCRERQCPSSVDPLETRLAQEYPSTTTTTTSYNSTFSQRIVCLIDPLVDWNVTGRVGGGAFHAPLPLGLSPYYTAQNSFTLSYVGVQSFPPLLPTASILDADTWAPSWTFGGGSLETALLSINTLPPFTLVHEVQEAGVWEPVNSWETLPSLTTRDSVYRDPLTVSTICSPLGNRAARIDFRGVGATASPPLLRVLGPGAAQVTITPVGVQPLLPSAQKLQIYECSLRGVCNRAAGNCSCAPQFKQSQGQRGDCGAFVHISSATTGGGSAGGPRSKVKAGVFK